MKFFLALSVVLLFGRINCQTVGETLESLGLTTLLGALTDTDLLDVIEGSAEITLFAPTNDALAAVDPLPGGDALIDLLTYHALPAVAPSTAIENELQLNSVAGPPVRFNIYNDGATYTAQGAPIDLTQIDIVVDNGLIHVLDAVMFPAFENIYEFISRDPNFATLLVAVDTAGLDEVLSEPGQMTVFAPDNAAFENVPSDVLDDLLADPEALTEVLLYHGVNQTLFSAGLNDGDVYETAQGNDILIVIDQTGVYINATDYAQVLRPDFSVNNGVIHAVNRVLSVVTVDEV